MSEAATNEGSESVGSVRSAGAVGSVEVVFSWRDEEGHLAPLDAELVERDRRTAVWIGSRRGLRFLLPAELDRHLGEDGRFRLVGVEEDHFVLHLPNEARVVLSKGGAPVELDAATRSIALEPGHVAEVRLGEFSFHVRTGAAAEALPPPAHVDWSALRWALAAFAVHALVLGMFFMAPPNAAALNSDLEGRIQRYVTVRMDAHAEETPEPERELQAGGGAGGGASEPDEAAGAGNDTPVPHVSGGPGARSGSARRGEAQAVTRESVIAIGTFAALSNALADMTGDASPFGNPLLTEGPGGPGFSHLVGGPGIGGWGGMDMHGSGRGTCLGPNCGQGTIASGPLSTRGDVGPGGVGDGIPSDGDRSPRVPPRVRPGEATTTGGLSRELVQRTIRRNLNQVRFCYEQGLQRRPDLEGRVSVRFMIGADGRVASASIADSSGTLDSVGQCAADSVRRWTFASSDGPTLVTYPFVFQSPR